MGTDSPTVLGPYRIERELGRGGMGIVYLALDTRLGRRVAIKALPGDVASDAERLARFEREARVLASLNHPNLAAVYDVLDVDGRRYLAMEYVEGESLADRIQREGAVPLAETLDLCAQIAAGMDAAHEGGVVHRDLKPPNVMITPGDRVKIVDFGLARGRVSGDEPPTRGHAVSPVLSSSPTLQSPGTMPGVILGTAPYLSPEQARGKVVDRRTDIWSFGCIVYECLTGRKLFGGDTVADTIAAILERPLDWSALPKSTPPRVRELLERCLERDPRKRLRDIGEARLMLDESRPAATAAATSRAPASQRTPPLRRVMPILGLLGAAILGWHLFGATILTWIRGPAAPVRRLSVVLPSDLDVSTWQLAPDGSALFLRTRPRTPKGEPPADFRIYRRRLDEEEFRAIPGTERVLGFGLSPDGKMIYFLANGAQGPDLRLARVPADGSTPVVPIAAWRQDWVPGSVLESGDMVFVAGGSSWARLRPDGSVSGPVAFGLARSNVFLGSVLPHDRGVLLMMLNSIASSETDIGVLDLHSRKAKLLLRNAGNPTWDPAGRLLFTRNGTLLAVPFDLGKLEVHGAPMALIDRLYAEPGTPAQADFSRDGTLAYRSGTSGMEGRRLVVVGRSGGAADWAAAEKHFDWIMRVSPDGTRAACTVIGEHGMEVWIVHRGQAAAQRLVGEPGADCFGPIWSPDGTRVAYGLTSETGRKGIFVRGSDGGGPPVFLGGNPAKTWIAHPTSWSPDGSAILVNMGELMNVDVGAVAAAPAGGTPLEPRSLISGPAFDQGAVFSPDGKWIALSSNESGRDEIYLCPYSGGAAPGPPTQVSTTGGRLPRWNRDGTGIVYESPDGRILSASVLTRPNLSVLPPTPIWDLNALGMATGSWDLLPDGSLLGVRKAKEEDEFKRIDVVLNFNRELDAKMARTR